MANLLVINQGTTWAAEISVADAAGVPLNPVGCTVRGQIRASVTSGTILHEWLSTGGTPNVTIATGKVTLTLTPTVTAAWTWTEGVYDVELTDQAGQVARIGEGRVVVSKEVTR